MARLQDAPNADRMESHDSAVLTTREREVLTLLSEGLSAKQIAPVLCISEHTVRTHRTEAIQRLGAKNSAHAVALFVRHAA